MNQCKLNKKSDNCSLWQYGVECPDCEHYEAKPKVISIEHGKSAIWHTNTLNNVLAQCRKLPGIDINRDYNAGTCKVTMQTKSGHIRELIRALQDNNNRWITRFDGNFLKEKI